MKSSFKALRVFETGDRQFEQKVVELTPADLPAGEVTIQVEWSSVNYKDALSGTGNKGVTRKYPHTPGIDAAGKVFASSHEKYKPGQTVLVTGHDLGSNAMGGYAEYIRVPADWVVPVPPNLTARDAMLYGTAGFTAAHCLMRMQDNGLTPDQGEVLVTGATGGVGSIAIGILSRLGYSVAAVTGKVSSEGFLKKLGAGTILRREDFVEDNKPLHSERWAGAVDTVGGTILATVLKSIKVRGSVAACGLAQSAQLPTTVFPFILRGVNLLGIDSIHTPRAIREQIWQNLAGPWRPEVLQDLATEITLEELPEKFRQILAGNISGRTLVKIGG